ncbi:MAG: hypothetical protein WDO24_10525 [Pseudomonadota bacterium]
MMMRWTNDHWLSNLHRVRQSGRRAGRIGSGGSRSRSFANPREDMSIECIPTCRSDETPAKYPPVQAGEYRFKKIRAAAGY